MKIPIYKAVVFFLIVFYHSCYSQLKVATGQTLYCSTGQIVFSNEDIINDGTIDLSNGKLYIAGNFDNNGTLLASQATIIVAGSNTQIFDFANLDYVKRLELDKSFGIATFNSGKLIITDGLFSSQGTLDGGEKLILQSTENKTAIVEESTGGIINNIVVERYFPAKRAYRFISSPVTSSNSINYSWQEGQNNTSTSVTNNSNLNPGYGTHISGSINGANGFDATLTGNPSLFLFSNTAQTWNPINNTNATVLNVGQAYNLLIRGDRSINLTNNTAPPTPTILRSIGQLKIGTYTNTDLTPNSYGYNLIGNPYQAPVDMSQVWSNSSNLESNFYYVWDPQIGGTNGRGGYVTYSFTQNINNVIGSSVNKFLQPMQACFVRTNAPGAASITFNENNKVNSTSNLNIYREVNTNSSSSNMRLTLYDTNAFVQQLTPLDGALLLFDSSSSDLVDTFDAGKITNLDENLSVVVGNFDLSIASFQNPVFNSVYPLKISQYKHTNYTLVIQLENTTGITPYLHDNFLNTYTEINPTINYNFTVNPNNNSSANNRFKIVYTNPFLDNLLFNEDAIEVFPNPSISNDFNIKVANANSNYSIKVFNSLGQLIDVSTSLLSENLLNCKFNSPITTGLYFVVISNGETSVVKKWIKK